VQHKAKVIARALAKHAQIASTPLDMLRCLGGFEIAALVGAYIRSAQLGVPVLVDGFISTVAALAAVRINPAVAPWLLLSHQSAEPAHGLLIAALGVRPLLQLDMRLGEASGAAIAVSLLHSACALHNEMASFADAGVSTGE
jgi:nicotinate-nucleotide--dimethylbenzimidazole phosphoribosyltransferase